MDDLAINRSVTIPADELRLSVARASGPGGQHVNKTETKVELRWNPGASAALSDAQRARLQARLASRLTGDGDLIVTAADHRSQHRNRELARERLADLVRRALIVPKRRVPTKPRRGAIERRIKTKKQRGQKKRDRTWRPD